MEVFRKRYNTQCWRLILLAGLYINNPVQTQTVDSQVITPLTCLSRAADVFRFNPLKSVYFDEGTCMECSDLGPITCPSYSSTPVTRLLPLDDAVMRYSCLMLDATFEGKLLEEPSALSGFPSPPYCQELCVDTPECWGWTFWDSAILETHRGVGGACQIFSSGIIVPSPVENGIRRVSGYRKCPPKPILPGENGTDRTQIKIVGYPQIPGGPAPFSVEPGMFVLPTALMNYWRMESNEVSIVVPLVDFKCETHTEGLTVPSAVYVSTRIAPRTAAADGAAFADVYEGSYGAETFDVQVDCAAVLETDVAKMTTTTTASLPPCYHEKASYRGTILREEEGTDAEACGVRCTKETTCTGYTFAEVSCKLFTNSTAGVVLLRQMPAIMDCNALCAGDPECTEGRVQPAMCRLFSKVTDVIAGAHTLGSSGPVMCPSAKKMPVEYPTRLGERILPLEGSGLLTAHLPSKDKTDVGAVVASCPSNYVEGPDSSCYQFHSENRTFREATRACSDEGGWLWTPTEGSLTEDSTHAELRDFFCSELGCTDFDGTATLWTGARKPKCEFQGPDGFPLRNLLVDEEQLPFGAHGLEKYETDVCVLMRREDDRFTFDLGTCGAYCVPEKPNVFHVDPSVALACNPGFNGRYYTPKRQFICHTVREGEAAPFFTRGFYTRRLVESKPNASTTKHCAVKGYDFGFGDQLGNIPTSGGWEACAAACNPKDGCNAYVYVGPQCQIRKEERDKGWTVTEVFSETVGGPDDCARLCASTMECNNQQTVYVPGSCYLKSTNMPQLQVKSWTSVISGPIPCPEGTPDEAMYMDPINPVSNPACPIGYDQASNGFCYGINHKRLPGPEAARACAMTGGQLASPKTPTDNEALMSVFCNKQQNTCRVPRGVALDGPYFMGLVSTVPGDVNAFKWLDGEAKTYHRFGGQDGNRGLFYGGWPTTQPDNTSGDQLCTYFYPRDHPSGDMNGGWGDEDCDAKCLVPVSSYSVQAETPECTSFGQAGRRVWVHRFSVCEVPPAV